MRVLCYPARVFPLIVQFGLHVNQVMLVLYAARVLLFLSALLQFAERLYVFATRLYGMVHKTEVFQRRLACTTVDIEGEKILRR